MTDYDNLSEFEAGLIKAFESIANQIQRLGISADASPQHMGAIALLAGNIEEGSEKIADALNNIATAIEERKSK
jgi:hypothetical protein